MVELRAGARFAGYRIIRAIGAGGMGAVYLAQHPRLPRQDALKVLDTGLGDDPEFRARFEREAELAALLEHPNIVSIYDRGNENGVLWISMRFVAGTDVHTLLHRGALPPRRALHIVEGAARGLDAAHRRNLLHRDVKPANILVSPGEDGTDTVRITDFGIARSMDSTHQLTVTGNVLASFAYAAPEQLSGTRLDQRTDIYALGCTLYEMLTGSKPYGTHSGVQVMYAHLHKPPPKPSVTRPGLPVALDTVIAQAMAKDPAHRYRTCAELAQAAVRAFEFTAPVPNHAPPTGTVPLPPGVPRTGHPHGPQPTAGSRPATASAIPELSGTAGRTGPSIGATGTGPAGLLGAPGANPSPLPRAAPRPRAAPSLLTAAVVGLLCAVAAVLGVRALGGNEGHAVTDDPTGATGPPSTVTATSATTATPATAATAAWGAAAYIVEAYPGLLPADPESAGYQGIRCALNNNEGSWLHCPAPDEHGFHINIRCSPRRQPVAANLAGEGLTDLREERWTRDTGSGIVRWGTDSLAGFGLLEVTFFDEHRNFCEVAASGGTGGQDVYDNWWTGAPL